MRLAITLILVVTEAGVALAADPEVVTTQEKASKGSSSKSSPCRDATSCFASCDQGSATACETVGGMFEHGIGVQQSNEKAIDFYQQSCRGGDKRACRKRNVLRANIDEQAQSKPPPSPARESKAASARSEPASNEADEPRAAGNKCQQKCARQRTKCLASSKGPMQEDSSEEGDEAATNPCALHNTVCLAKCSGAVNPSQPEGIDPMQIGNELAP